MEQEFCTAPGGFDDLADEYDPLFDGEPLDEEDESFGQSGPEPGTSAKLMFAHRQADRPAAERIADLFQSLETRRRILLGILRYLDEPKRSDALEDQVAELQKYDHAVYSGYDYSLLLEEAGAIRKVSEDGSDFDEEAEQLPDVVEIDGSRFYRPTDGKQVFWVIAEEGQAYLDADDPFGRLAELLAKDRKYHPIYKDVLEACLQEGGATIGKLNDIVEATPLSKNPRRHCSYFAKCLEDCGALQWAGSWKTTDVGRTCLETLLTDDGDPADASDGGNTAETNEGGRGVSDSPQESPSANDDAAQNAALTEGA